VKVLGILGLVDKDELDWKVIAIQDKDELAHKLNDVEDLQTHYPHIISGTWRDGYYTPDLFCVDICL
jgi:inorganic pyrophosphatase